jgi:TM2 domain-containing membrane protein YozV
MTYPPPGFPPSGPGFPPQMPPPAPPPYDPIRDANGKKIAAGICAIMIGQLGIHKFILGYTTAGLIMLLSSILTCGLAGIVMHIIGIIEGIMYLTKPDEEFYRTYMVGRKEWF